MGRSRSSAGPRAEASCTSNAPRSVTVTINTRICFVGKIGAMGAGSCCSRRSSSKRKRATSIIGAAGAICRQLLLRWSSLASTYFPAVRSGRVLPIPPPAIPDVSRPPRPLEPSKSESTLGSALLAIAEECGPTPDIVDESWAPVYPVVGSRGRALLVSRGSWVSGMPVILDSWLLPCWPDLMLIALPPSSTKVPGVREDDSGVEPCWIEPIPPWPIGSRVEEAVGAVDDDNGSLAL